MAASNDGIQALKLLKGINADYYDNAREAAKRGRPVGYVNVFAPTELFYAMDIVPIYPENHAVFIQARKLTLEILAIPERLGFVPGLCSYALVDLGHMLSGKSPVGGLPKPDFFLTTNAQCGSLTKWFERMSEYYHVPLFVIDVPFTGGKPDHEHCENYVRAQLDELVEFLEGISGEPLDRQKFRDIIDLSNQTISLWKEIVESAVHIPSPISVFDQFFCMAPIVAQRGSKVALEFYRELRDEIKAHVSKGVGAIPREKHRLYWDSLPLWHELKWLSDLLTSFDACLVSTIYTLPWSQFKLDPDDPITSWTEEYVHYFDWHLKRRIDLIIEQKEKYHLNGFIFHNDRSCKMFSTAIPEIKRLVQERTGIPGYILEGDHGDPRFCSKDQIERGLSNYFDLLKALT